MQIVHSLIAALALTLVVPAAADAAQVDPEVIIYRFPGVRDDGSANFAGTATVFHCTNFSGATETIRFVTRDHNSILVTNKTSLIAHLTTLTAFTHFTASYPIMLLLDT